MDHDTQGPEMLCGAIVASDDAAEDIEMALAGSANQRQFIEDVVALVARFDHWSGPPTIDMRLCDEEEERAEIVLTWTIRQPITGSRPFDILRTVGAYVALHNECGGPVKIGIWHHVTSCRPDVR